MTNTRKLFFSKKYSLSELPEFQEFQMANPQNEIDEMDAAIMYGRAIHWLSFLEILWPPFETKDSYRVWINYIVWNDPRRNDLPKAFYQQMALTLKMFWTIQLEDMYPDGNWAVIIQGWEEEIILDAEIYKRE